MKMKKVLAICLASAMTFSLAACGSGTTGASAPAAGETAADETDAAGAKDEDVNKSDATDVTDAGSIPAYTQLDLSQYGDTEATIMCGKYIG